VLDEADIDMVLQPVCAQPGDRDDWRFAPLNTPDVDGVAPAWVGLAECDPLVDEGVMYADKLRAAGVPVDLEIYRGVTHEFIKMGRIIPEARQAHADAAKACAAPLGWINPTTTASTMKRQDFRFFHRLRVRWAEVDMQKIVFNAHYLMYFDTAMTDYWRALALPYEETMVQLGGDLYVKKASVEYHGSARFDDRLDVALKCARIGTSSMTFPARSSTAMNC
jgi:YbgC/YbaW family acyl-CoA thioester hydrolase